MKNTNFKVGVIVPPDEFYKPVLYSDAQASRNFYAMNKDIYEGKKRAKNINDKKTPKAVFIAIGIAALTMIPFAKKLFKKFYLINA